MIIASGCYDKHNNSKGDTTDETEDVGAWTLLHWIVIKRDTVSGELRNMVIGLEGQQFLLLLLCAHPEEYLF